VIVEDAAPVVRAAVALEADATHYGTVAGHLVPIVQIVDGVKDGFLVVELHHLSIWGRLSSCCP
jgi:hypothetical protein